MRLALAYCGSKKWDACVLSESVAEDSVLKFF